MEWVTTKAELVPQLIAERLETLLRDHAVTWFVSGGSNIQYQVITLQLLIESNIDLSRLTILLVDERFGLVGHSESNWQQLTDAGFMQSGPIFIMPFTSNEQTLEDAVNRYETIINSVLNNGSYKFAQLGMGDDGHTAGILPNSVATSSTSNVIGYVHEPYERLTLGFSALKQLDEVALVAFGESKQQQLNKFRQPHDISEQPIQVIKDIKHVTIYTEDQT